jgi:N6-L-threonylcarbamoyladenine synthase
MKILAIDTSCDETSAAVTDGAKVLSNIIWSQASAHARFGGVMPSLAQRMHEERIDFVVNKALSISRRSLKNIDAVAVTVGPGLSIALGVGVDHAKKIAKKYKKKLFASNHVEAHILSPLAIPRTENFKFQISNFKLPAYGLCLSGGNTIFVLMEKIGKYKILAETHDDALGEALDKAARLLGFGYPGAAVLEKIAKEGNPKGYKLPVPLIDDKIKNRFSYSGLKTAFVRLVDSINNPAKRQVSDLAASFQEVAFTHIINVLEYQISNHQSPKATSLLFGGGVANNLVIRRKLRELCKRHGLELMIPYSKKLLGDNAAMIGVAAFLNPIAVSPDKIDRDPRAKLPF